MPNLEDLLNQFKNPYEQVTPPGAAYPESNSPPIPSSAPGQQFEGPNLTPLPAVAPAAPTYTGPSLFDRASQAYQTIAPSMEEPPKPEAPAKAPPAPAKEEMPEDKEHGKTKDLLSRLMQTSGDQRGRAEEATAKNILYANLAGAASKLAAGIAGHGAKADEEGSAMLLKTAGMPLEQLNQREESQSRLLKNQTVLEELRDKQYRRDPNSNVSKSTRDFIAMVYPEAAKMPNFQHLPADDAEKLFPKLAQMHDNKIKMEYLKLAKQQAGSEKEDKRFSEFSNKLAGEISSSRSAFGKAANNYSAAERIEALAAGRDPNSLTTREIAEMAINLDGLFRAGQPTISGTDKLIPKTARGDVAKLQEFITNEVHGANQGDFVHAMLTTVAREKALAHDQIQRTQGKIMSGYTDLQKKNPERWNNIMNVHGLPQLGEGKGPTSSVGKPSMAGKIIDIKGKQFKVADDGDTLIPITSE